MLELIVLRHGQTDSNVERRIMGHSDIGLNEKGKRESVFLKDKLKDDKIDEIYCSDLLRCRETLQAAGLGLYERAVFTEDLREMNFGLWEGLMFTEIGKQYPDLFDSFMNNRLDFSPPGGESYMQMSKRVIDLVEKIRKNKAEKVLLVTHHGGASAIIANYIFEDFKKSFKFFIENSRVSRLVFKDDGSVFLKSLNE